MRLESDEFITAEVVLRIGGSGRLSPENGASVPRKYRNRTEPGPSPAALVTVMGAFQALGFEMGPLQGMSFSISGSVQKFTHVFQTVLRRNAVGSLECVDEAGLPSLELPLSGLPSGVTRLIETVVFLPPDELLPDSL
jgi:hypothetical protein